MKNLSFATLLFLLISNISFGQKVGLVLSGGGAKGLAHVGVLMALEENNIPIDYITGTSIGALVGSLYCTGHSPKEIAKILTSEEIRQNLIGKWDSDSLYFYKENPNDASMFHVQFSLKDSIFTSNLPTTLVSSTPIDFDLMKTLAPHGAKLDYHLDSLFIPFRSVASDIYSKKPIVFANDYLPTAVRSSMAFPFYLKPVVYKNYFLFDGGLYNNFPADVMYNEFLPDVIIGSNVASKITTPRLDDIVSQLDVMLSNTTTFEISCPSNIMIEPQVPQKATFDFNHMEDFVQIGYEETLLKIAEIRTLVYRNVSIDSLKSYRLDYKSKLPPLLFDKVHIKGLNKNNTHYAQKIINTKKRPFTAEALKTYLARLDSDDKLNIISQKAIYNKEKNIFSYEVDLKKQKELQIDFGGNISSNAINQAFLGVKYNIINRLGYSPYLKWYFGQFHNSLRVGGRIDVPATIPFYADFTFTLNKWDYFKNQKLFEYERDPNFLITREQFFKSEFGLPLSSRSVFLGGLKKGRTDHSYYQGEIFTLKDTADRTKLDFTQLHVKYKRSSLNHKQYPFKGHLLSLKATVIRANELTIPGNLSRDNFAYNDPYSQSFGFKRKNLEWSFLHVKYQQYFNAHKNIRIGIQFEGNISTEYLLSNSKATLLYSPTYAPEPLFNTLFIKEFRAQSYYTAGITSVHPMFKEKIQLRLGLSAYLAQNELTEDPQGIPFFDPTLFPSTYYIGNITGVYRTPIGPIGLSYSIIPGLDKSQYIYLHFGYTLFQERGL